MNHTPGPWTIQALPHKHDFRAGESYAIRDTRNCCLATVGEVDAIHDGPESAANARLITQAPSMLDRLRARVRDCRLHITICNAPPGSCECAQCQADRAILRAVEG